MVIFSEPRSAINSMRLENVWAPGLNSKNIPMADGRWDLSGCCEVYDITVVEGADSKKAFSVADGSHLGLDQPMVLFC